MKQQFESLKLAKFASAQLPKKYLSAITGGDCNTSWSEGSKSGTDTNNGGTTKCNDGVKMLGDGLC